jgi:hypothetical protein
VGNPDKAFVHGEETTEALGVDIEYAIAVKINGKNRGVARNRWRKGRVIGHFCSDRESHKKFEEQ